MSGRRALLAVALATLVWALLVWLVGGVETSIGGLAIRARGVFRPLALGIVLLTIAAALERRSLRAAMHDPAAAISGIAPALVATLALVAIVDAVRYGSFVAAGSDSYGYLSQAYGWATGHLPRPYPVPLALPFPSSDWLQTPLGYWQGREPHTIVPSYAPGLPLLMAAGIIAFGALGPYLVVPLSAGVFVWMTYLLARRVAGPVEGAAAALLVSTSPAILFMSLSPMSDVPAGAVWTAAAATALGNCRRGARLAGSCAAVGILVRPNMAPLALVPFGWIALTTAGGERIRRLVFYCAPVIAAAVAVAALNAYWYGSPLLSGYGNPRNLYSLRYVGRNVRQFGTWLVQSQSIWMVVAVASSVASAATSVASAFRRKDRAASSVASAFRRKNGDQRHDGSPVAFAWAFLIVTVACYITYRPFDQWWYLRFLLPGFGALFALAAVGLRTIAERRPRVAGRTIALLLLALVLWRSAVYTASLDMYGPFQESERKYADVGAFISRQPADAVFFAMQHSGTIRYYGGRHTLRYDLLDADTAKRAPRELERLGLHPYLAIDDAELRDVRRAFGLPADVPLPWPYVARTNRFGGLSIYDLAAAAAAAAPLPIEHGAGPRYSAPLPVVMQARRRGES